MVPAVYGVENAYDPMDNWARDRRATTL
jgi:hypothetical protein